MDKQKIIKLLNSKDIRCIGNSEEVIFVDSINDYINKDNKNYCDGINLIINSESVQDDISQLYCILECGCHRNMEDYYNENGAYDKDLSNFIQALEKIRDKPTEIHYYWYHHMMPISERRNISKAIQKHDFETFIEYYKKYNSEGIKQGFIDNDEFNAFFPIIYLPDEASYVIDNEWHWLNILERDNFNRISFEECECG